MSKSKLGIRFVCIGDLVADYYYTDSVLTKVDGGRSKFNDLANLASMGNECVTFSYCNDSNVGDMICKSLSRCGVNTEYVKKANLKNRIYHLIKKENGEYYCTYHCPICNSYNWYEESIAQYDNMHEYFKPNDVFIFDSIRKEDINNIVKLHGYDILLDLGNINYLKKLSDDELRSILNINYEIVQINQKVANYLMTRFKYTEYQSLRITINCKLLIITLGKIGSIFINDKICFKKEIDKPACEKDTLGAGDVFFSTFINAYYENCKNFDDKIIEKIFNIAIQNTSKVVQSEGGRGHLYSNFRINKIEGICVCQDFELLL